MRCPAPKEEIVWGGRTEEFRNPESRIWLERMAARGWTAPTWPGKYGGGGLTSIEAKILKEELRRIGARSPLSSFGLLMLGPVLLEFGSEEQRLRFIPPIVLGQTRWCQGYSEPNAGSDLAALTTSAQEAGANFIVNGSKIWTSYADKADSMFCLVRTGTSSKRGGISFLLIDMASPGIEVRPLRLISGDSIFCEVFFTDVAVPKVNLVGAPGQGWTIAKALLAHERRNVAASGFGAGHQISAVEKAVTAMGLLNGRLADPHYRQRLARARIETDLVVRLAQHGKAVSPAVLKILAAESQQVNAELEMDLHGAAVLSENTSEDLRNARNAWLRSKANSIEGGTTEINLNLIATKTLGLSHGERRVDG